MMLDHEKNTQLKGRVLWYDGTSTVCSMEYLYDRLLDGASICGLFVDRITPEIKKYNALGKPDAPLMVKESIDEFSKNWNIPENYKKLDLYEYMAECLEAEITNDDFDQTEIDARIARLHVELDLWFSHNMQELLTTLIYMVDQFEEHDIVWGTGRGSSCSSYILYLIGIHDVDSVFYNLDIGEFFRD